jgi:sugar phosphate isomerase/epimerase
VRLAFYTYSYIDRLGMEPSEVIPRVADAGYDGIDLSATWRADDDPALFPAERRREIRRLVEAHGLTIEALVTHLPLAAALRDGRPINLAGAVELAAELGAPIVTFHIGSAAGSDPRPDWARVADHLRSCADTANAAGVRLASDATFPDFLTPTPESVVRLIEEVGSPYLGHNFDPCYLAVCGQEVGAAARMLGPYCAHVHVKDHLGEYPHFEHRIPGEGEMDHADWIGPLLGAGFRGAAAVECFPDAPLDHALRVGRRTLVEAMERAAP